MKWYIKKINENFIINKKDDIIQKIKELNINLDTCIINQDYTVTVNGNVDISNKRLKYIPIKFKEIYGSFDCSNNMLTSMENFPEKITQSFNCSNNNIKSFKEGPKYVGGDYDVSSNYLTSFDNTIEIKGRVNISNNNLPDDLTYE